MQGAIAAGVSAVVGGLFLMGVYWLMRRNRKDVVDLVRRR
jgi:hypothetical protein